MRASGASRSRCQSCNCSLSLVTMVAARNGTPYAAGVTSSPAMGKNASRGSIHRTSSVTATSTTAAIMTAVIHSLGPRIDVQCKRPCLVVASFVVLCALRPLVGVLVPRGCAILCRMRETSPGPAFPPVCVHDAAVGRSTDQARTGRGEAGVLRRHGEVDRGAAAGDGGAARSRRGSWSSSISHGSTPTISRARRSTPSSRSTRRRVTRPMRSTPSARRARCAARCTASPCW